MPILGGIPVVETPPPLPDPMLESRSLALRALDGTYPLPFTGFTAEGNPRELFFMPDCEGLDMPPRENITAQLAGMEGSILQQIRTTARDDIFLPLWLSSESSHAQYLGRRDALVSLFNYRRVDYQAAGGTLEIVARSLRGERYLRVAFKGGMSSVKKPNESNHYAKLPLEFQAVKPYWYGERWSTPEIRIPPNVAWFGHFPGRLAPSRALGENIEITVGGDANSWADVDLIGPASAVSVVGPGLEVSIPDGLADGEVVQIVTEPGPRTRRALFDGVSDWSRIGPVTRWGDGLKPGVNQLTISMEDATTASSAVVSGWSLFERWC